MLNQASVRNVIPIFIDCEAREIICLVASVRPSVRLFVCVFTLCACCGVVDIWARRAEC